jgi:hypothetical protein
MNLLPMAAVACALALGGCSSAPSSEVTVAQARPGNMRNAEKALAIAHLSYQATGITLEEAARIGALRGANAATARALYDEAGTALALADAADAAANSETTLAEIASVEALIAEITALIPRQE